MSFDPLTPVWVIVVAAAVLAALVWWRIRRGGSRRTRRAVMWWAGGGALIVAALCGPSIGRTEAPEFSRLLDVVIAVDTTGSMGAVDGPDGSTRLDMARADVTALVARFAGARFCVVTVAASAATVLPFTRDVGAIQSLVDVLEQEPTRRSRGSDLALLVPEVEAAARRSATTPGRSRLLFVLTDGEQNAVDETRPFTDLRSLFDGGAVIGYGTTEGGRMHPNAVGDLTPSTAWILDPQTGEPAVSHVDLANLQAISQATGLQLVVRPPVTPISGVADQVRSALVQSGTQAGTPRTVLWLVMLAALVVSVPLLVSLAAALADARALRSAR